MVVWDFDGTGAGMADDPLHTMVEDFEFGY